jgi:hypothetical protein
MQGRLFDSLNRTALPTRPERYVPVLLNRSGERTALSTASNRAWDVMTPLIRFVGPKKKAERQLSSGAIKGWIENVATAVGNHPVYVDVLRLDPAVQLDDGNGRVRALDLIFREARMRHVTCIPVAPTGGDEQHLAMVRDAAYADRNGVALRHHLTGAALSPGTSVRDVVGATLAALETPPDDADLLLDLGYIDLDVDLDPELLSDQIEACTRIGTWRGIVLIGGSMPTTLSDVPEDSLRELPRNEWQTWRKLASADLHRMPAFGDYAVQHPTPPADGGPGMRANVRYTCEESTLVSRGRQVTEGKEQYVGVCRRIVESPHFRGEDYSPGDRLIRRWATGDIGPGGQDVWRGAGTSHHLQLVTDQLRALAV